MKTTNKEKPILFSTPMVKAILEGRKTQTRRVIKPQPKKETDKIILHGGDVKVWTGINLNKYFVEYLKPKYKIGDILWVRETWNKGIRNDNGEYEYVYKTYNINDPEMVWKPSIHMPREAARIFLEVTDVRVERLKNITENDAISEGMLSYHNWESVEYKLACNTAAVAGKKPPIGLSPVNRFKYLWNSLNAKRGYSWEANPWVWVIEFRRIEK